MKVSAATVVSRWSFCIAETPALTPRSPSASQSCTMSPLCSGQPGWGHPSSALQSVWGTPGASPALGGTSASQGRGTAALTLLFLMLDKAGGS